MSILPTTDIEFTLHRLFPWTKKQHSGVTEDKIRECEQKLGHQLPEALRKLYLVAGLDPTLMSSFNRFAPIDELVIRDQKIIFVEENQGSSWWGVEIEAHNPKVFKQNGVGGNWIKEKEPTLEQFLGMLIYTQCIQAGYKYCGITGLSGGSLYNILESEWEKVVDYNGLHVYWQTGALIWSIEFGEEEDIENDIFFSTYSDELYYLNEIRYQLVEI